MLESLFNKVVELQVSNVIKKTFQYSCFSVNIAKFLRTPILKNICERLFLNVCLPVQIVGMRKHLNYKHYSRGLFKTLSYISNGAFRKIITIFTNELHHRYLIGSQVCFCILARNLSQINKNIWKFFCSNSFPLLIRQEQGFQKGNTLNVIRTKISHVIK